MTANTFVPRSRGKERERLRWIGEELSPSSVEQKENHNDAVQHFKIVHCGFGLYTVH